MDIIEFAEKFTGATLHDYQKNCIRYLDTITPNGKIYIAINRSGGVYIYPNQKTLKELLTYGEKNVNK